MRPLDETETSVVFEKLFKFVGNNLKNLVENPSHEGPDSTPGRYCFRLNKNKIYYCSESLVKRATNIARPNLVSLGTCIGKYTHGGNFHLTVQALNLLAANAKHKFCCLDIMSGHSALRLLDSFVKPPTPPVSLLKLLRKEEDDEEAAED
ncbi:uncharacterized protein LOC127107571 [Lathyrus oleraceus]|uniref:uncharacterized protein LOC127107571 n=1 Tax=Pisum sativum TaxID=3888 RepID=UPI0021CE6569|nr:uncharacterized protein LOC127107571 [Pisum sativum]